MEDRDREPWDRKSPNGDSDIGSSDNFNDESDRRGSGSDNMEGIGKSEEDEDIERYEDTTPMSNRGTLSEH